MDEARGSPADPAGSARLWPRSFPGAVRESRSPPDEKGSWPRWPAWLGIAATFMIEADDAARRIADAIETEKRRPYSH